MDLRARWNHLTRELSAGDHYWRLTATNARMRDLLGELIPRLRAGTTLDVGAGWLAFKGLLGTRPGIRYLACDIRQTPGANFIGDALLLPVRSGALQNVICSAVLEHVGEPQVLLRELARALVADGVLIVTVPHFHYIHGEPRDYYRFTRFGLEYLLERAGFRVVAILPVGGLVNFLSTLVSTAFLSLFAGTRALRPVALALNRWMVHLAVAVDSRVDREKRFALGYVAMAEPRNGTRR